MTDSHFDEPAHAKDARTDRGSAQQKRNTRDQIRRNYELKILQTTVFHTKTRGDTIRAAIKYAYDRVFEERRINKSTTIA